MNSSILTTLYNTVKKKYGLSFYYFDHFTYFTTNYIFFSNPISEGFGKTCSFYKSNVACKHSSLPTPCIFLHHLFISTYMLTHLTELNIPCRFFFFSQLGDDINGLLHESRIHILGCALTQQAKSWTALHSGRGVEGICWSSSALEQAPQWVRQLLETPDKVKRQTWTTCSDEIYDSLFISFSA